MTDRETVSSQSGSGGPPSESSDRDGDFEAAPQDVLLPPSIGKESVVFHSERAGGDAPDHLAVTSSSPLAIDTMADHQVTGAGSLSGGNGGKVRIGDRVFGALTSGAGWFIILLVVLIAVFLIKAAASSIYHDNSNFLFSRDWDVTDPTNLHFGVLGLLWVTIIISMIAMILAVPVAIGIALFITHYAPRRMARPVAYIIDLLAAIPSIIYGIWGITILAPALEPVQRALYHLGGFPLLKAMGIDVGTIFNGSVVLAVMILPIVTAISRDVFERTPRANIEAALALGATKWEMIRLAVLPYGRPGVVSGSMLGLGRALGETIAITLILSVPGNGSPFSWSIFNGGETFASKIANSAGEFGSGNTGPYIAAGLVLFVLTFVVNAAARAIVNRRKDFV
jgi:phosphate transport system permease protein